MKKTSHLEFFLTIHKLNDQNYHCIHIHGHEYIIKVKN
jgi:hypothetical protein